GVKKPSLKAIARTPQLPHYKHQGNAKGAARRQVVRWLGGMFTSLAGEEFSAFGVNKEEGGLLINRLSLSSPLAGAKLQAEDVIQTINGKPVKDKASLQKAIAGLKEGDKVEIGYVRFQNSQKLSFTHP
ncbi:MAG: PDZ domain-containing protein, partial [Akkermansiaceae bacterium]